MARLVPVNRTRAFCALGWILSCFLLCSGPAASAQTTDVLTYHNDLARTGRDLNEQILTPANVNSNQFGKLWVLPADGAVLAQPLYAAGVSIPGVGIRNVLIVVTENDSVYAYDADSTNLFWQVSVLGAGEIPFQTTFCTITPEIGITATPVIDRQFGPDGTIFVQAMSQDASTNCFQRLHALDLATGQERLAPATITGTYPGTGDGSVNGTVIFSPSNYLDRACLMLVNGVVYTFWSGHCNNPPYTSFVIGYNEYTLAQTSVIDLEPNNYGGSIWNSGAGPAADAGGNIYVALGNSTYQDFSGPLTAQGFPADGDYGCALVKLSTANNSLVVTDYFAMYNASEVDEDDWDLGSGAPLVVPDQTNALGQTKQLVVIAGKDQNMYIANRTNMGKFNPSDYQNSYLYQELPDIFPGPDGSGPDNLGRAGGCWSMPAYFNGTLYFGPNNGRLSAFPFNNALLSTYTSQAPTVFGFPGATPSISANGTSNGIVWVVETIGKGQAGGLQAKSAILHAYLATDLGVELYNSNEATNSRDQFGKVADFVTPMIASARVYSASTLGVAVFGLLTTTVLTPIEQWRNTNFRNPSNVGAGANSAAPAGDGVPNLIKYAFGLNPFTPVTTAQLGFASLLQSNGQSYVTLTINRTGNPTDVTLLPQVSSDLQTWTSGPSCTTALTNTPTQLVIMDNAASGSGTNQYMTLTVTNP